MTSGPSATKGSPGGWLVVQDSSDSTPALLVHVLGVLTWFVGPLVLWLAMRRDSRLVDAHGRENLGWQACVLTLWFVFGLVLEGRALVLGWLGLYAAHLTFSIRAAVAAAHGRPFRFPLALRFPKRRTPASAERL